MRRRIVLFLLILLPLQLVWTAASAYCQHETGARQASHVGHHFHAHQGADGSSPTGTPTAAGASDSDCASCHAAGSAMLPDAVRLRDFAAPSITAAGRPTPACTSAFARAPDRPQWLRLV